MKYIFCLALLSAGTASYAAQTTPPAGNTGAALQAQRVNIKAHQPTKPVTAAAKPKVSPAHPAAKPGHAMQVPPGAVEAGDGTFHFKDATGKSWVYRKTPFGVTRAPEGGPKPVIAANAAGNTRTPFGVTKTSNKPSSTPPPSANRSAQVTAVAEGNQIVFRRETPFGASSWRKNKTDLNEDEQKIWEQEQSKRNQ